MKVIVIGHVGHGKSTLVKAIELLSKQGIECIEADTSDLIDLMKEQKEKDKQLEEYAKKELILAEPKSNRETRRGNKKLKSWEWKR